ATVIYTLSLHDALPIYEDKVFITAKCGEKYPPKVIGAAGQPLTEADVYGGCYARAQLIARPYYFGPNAGVKFNLVQIMKVKDGRSEEHTSELQSRENLV